METKIFVKVLGFILLNFYNFTTLYVLFSLLFFSAQSSTKIPNGRIQNENLLHRRYCYSIECCVWMVEKNVTNSRKKNLFEHKFKNCACFSVFGMCVCDPFSISGFHFSSFLFSWKPTSYTRVKLTNFVSCIKFIAAFFLLDKNLNVGKKNTIQIQYH